MITYLLFHRETPVLQGSRGSSHWRSRALLCCAKFSSRPKVISFPSAVTDAQWSEPKVRNLREVLVEVEPVEEVEAVEVEAAEEPAEPEVMMVEVRAEEQEREGPEGALSTLTSTSSTLQ
jgi:hypothetical protein